MSSIEVVYAELTKFSSEVLELHRPALSDHILVFEHQIDCQLPKDFKALLQLSDGFNLIGTEVYGIGEEDTFNLARAYHIEHELVAVPQYSYLVPFSPDGRGNFYCLDTSKLSLEGKTCPVVFWVSNHEYSAKDEPEVTHQSFTEWMQECVIDWTLEDYDYEGNEK